MYIINRKCNNLFLKIFIITILTLLIFLNLEIGLNNESISFLNVIGLSLDQFQQGGFASVLECCSATATDCGKKCYITSACPDCTCYGGGDSAGCWCLEPPEFYGVYCSSGGSCPPDDPGCELIRE